MQDIGMGQVAGLRAVLSAGCLRLLDEVVDSFESCHPSNIPRHTSGASFIETG